MITKTAHTKRCYKPNGASVHQRSTLQLFHTSKHPYSVFRKRTLHPTKHLFFRPHSPLGCPGVCLGLGLALLGRRIIARLLLILRNGLTGGIRWIAPAQVVSGVKIQAHRKRRVQYPTLERFKTYINPLSMWQFNTLRVEIKIHPTPLALASKTRPSASSPGVPKHGQLFVGPQNSSPHELDSLPELAYVEESTI